MSNTKAQVLIVEDEPEIAELIEFHAERAGMQARKVHSGRIALDVIKREKPDLIVLDLMLPDLDGLEVCRKLKQGGRRARFPSSWSPPRERSPMWSLASSSAPTTT